MLHIDHQPLKSVSICKLELEGSWKLGWWVPSFTNSKGLREHPNFRGIMILGRYYLEPSDAKSLWTTRSWRNWWCLCYLAMVAVEIPTAVMGIASRGTLSTVDYCWKKDLVASIGRINWPTSLGSCITAEKGHVRPILLSSRAAIHP